MMMQGAVIMRWKISMILFVSLIVSIMASFNSSTVHACSCAQPLTVEEELNRSEAIFAGRVLEVREHNSNGYRTKSALFDVSQIWKGGPESQIIIYTGSGGGDCGYHFEKGKEYLVYAKQSTMYGNKDQLVTIMCDRTNILAQAQDDLTILGVGNVPTELVNFEEKSSSAYLYVWIIVVGIVLGAAILFAWRKVRR